MTLHGQTLMRNPIKTRIMFSQLGKNGGMNCLHNFRLFWMSLTEVESFATLTQRLTVPSVIQSSKGWVQSWFSFQTLPSKRYSHSFICFSKRNVRDSPASSFDFAFPCGWNCVSLKFECMVIEIRISKNRFCLEIWLTPFVIVFGLTLWQYFCKANQEWTLRSNNWAFWKKKISLSLRNSAAAFDEKGTTTW